MKKKIVKKSTNAKKNIKKKTILKKNPISSVKVITDKKSKQNKSKGKLIMVVDDEQDIRTTVKTVLQNSGFEVVTAVNADDCLRKLKTIKPALIILDIMMPGTPVKDAIPKMGNVKIVFLSVVRLSEAEKEDLLKSKNVIAFIQKPFDVSALVAKVKKLTA